MGLGEDTSAVVEVDAPRARHIAAADAHCADHLVAQFGGDGTAQRLVDHDAPDGTSRPICVRRTTRQRSPG